jgi:peptidoglycan/LPS O-acetylase OafA/YrhL
LPDLLARTALAAVAAVVVNVLVRALAVALFDIPDTFEHIALRAVIVSTLIGVAAAGVVYAVIRRDRTFVIVAAVALVLSLAAPLSVSDEGDAAAVGTLMCMHVTTAAIVVFSFTRRERPDERVGGVVEPVRVQVPDPDVQGHEPGVPEDERRPV